MERNIYVLVDENNIILDFIGIPKEGYVLKSNYKNAAFLSEGFYVDDENKGFVPLKPYPSWIYNPSECLYNAPITYPASSDSSKSYTWDEETVSWKEIIKENVNGI